MKIYISVDMEGVTGVTSPVHIKEHRMLRIMTQEVNAAVRGAFKGGAKEVLVNDSHGNGTNILIDELDERAELISGCNKLLGQMEGIDETFAAAFFIGYHAHEGNGDSVLGHSITGGVVTQIRRNGEVVGETAINAGIAGHFGVPVVLVAGDDVVCREAQATLGKIETVTTKYAIDRFAARSLPIKKSQSLIEEAAELALRRIGEISLHKTPVPVNFELTTKLTNMAHMCELLPTVTRSGPKTVIVESDDYLGAYRQLRGCLLISWATSQGYKSKLPVNDPR